MVCILQSKYQINIDGTVAAYRLPYLLAGNSLVLKQDSIYYEHFYNELQPWKHFVPFKNDLSDLMEKLQWAKDHDGEVKMHFINKNLLIAMLQIYLVWYYEIPNYCVTHTEGSWLYLVYPVVVASENCHESITETVVDLDWQCLPRFEAEIVPSSA